jgi:ornithine cyclodeaminase/alanine dehydrogenase
LACEFEIKRVYAYDINPDAQKRFVEEMSDRTGVDIVGVDSPKSAVVGSDLVVTSGPILKHPKPTIERDWLRPGSFASAVDFDSYWKPEALAQIDKLSTDDHAQFQYYKGIGYFQGTPDPYADLGEIVAGIKPGREREDERTMAMNLGLALDDMAVAPEVFRRAKEKGLGVWLSL